QLPSGSMPTISECACWEIWRISVCRYASGIQSFGSILSSASTRAWKRASSAAVSAAETCNASFPSESSPCVYTHCSNLSRPCQYDTESITSQYFLCQNSSMTPDPLAHARGTVVTGFQRQRPVRSGPLLITVLGDSIAPRGGVVTLGSLIRLAEPFGVPQRLVRTSVGRLAKDGWLTFRR